MEHSPESTPQELMTAILDSIADGVITMDRERRITSFNQAAERITGVDRAQALGRPCCEVLRASICLDQCVFGETLKTGQPAVSRAVQITNAAGETVAVSITTALLRNARGEVIGGVETVRDLSLIEALRKKLTGRYTFHDIVSKNHRMQELFAILPTVAASDSTVLIEGESGTGKELLARALHHLSLRGRHPLVAVNCGALPDTLLESELFGYKAGAFTDARRDKAGRFAMAEGGTLLLDEIGDISPAMQVRLLRVLQEHTYEPLGATRPERANVRIIAASNRNLRALVAAGRFREDLFYRINVVRLELPPLRMRRDDLPLLVDHFIARFNRLQGRTIEGVAPDAMDRLVNHTYPGNIRELENIVEHAFVLCDGPLIQPRHLPRWMSEGGDAETLRPQSGEDGHCLQTAERQALRDALERHGWNRLATAQALGIHKSTLFRKIKALGLDNLPPLDGRKRPDR